MVLGRTASHFEEVGRTDMGLGCTFPPSLYVKKGKKVNEVSPTTMTSTENVNQYKKFLNLSSSHYYQYSWH